jgi:plasmid stabilization system protein ParE
MSVRFHPQAVVELEGAALYYEQQRDGLGGRFVAAVEVALLSIQDTPKRWPTFDQEVRRRMVRAFPYFILYSIEPKFILILAVIHAHQRPLAWAYRRISQ